MKHLMIGIALMSAIVAANAQNNFSLKGNVDKTYSGQKAYIAECGRNGAKIDSATISTNGSFSMKNVKFTEPRMVTFYIGKEKQISTDFILEDAPLKVTCETDEEKTYAYVQGCKTNDIHTTMTKELEAVIKHLHKLQKEKRSGNMSEERKSEWDKEYSSLGDQYDQIEQDYMLKNADNYIGFYYLQFRYYRMELDKVKTCYGKWSPKYKESEVGKKLAKWIDCQEKTQIGCTFIDFAMKTPEGKEVKLSDYAGKGKYVFIDFWASWCGPCRAEIPNVVKAYSTYKDKGLEIVGVSLDQKEDAWKKAIADLGITWPQMSDLKAWNCEGAKLYGINAIPATILLDPDGKIIAKNLRGSDLEKKLGEYLK